MMNNVAGQTVYILDRSRHCQNMEYKKVTIQKVGRKYIYLFWNNAYYKKNQNDLYYVEKRNIGSPNLLFTTLDDYKNWKEQCELKKWQWTVKDLTLSVDQLRRMKQIADEESEDKE